MAGAGKVRRALNKLVYLRNIVLGVDFDEGELSFEVLVKCEIV